MPRHTDKKVLSKGHYAKETKLVLRKKYNSFFKPSTHLQEELLQLITQTKPKRILDVGCGNGDFLINLRKNGFEGELTGLELSKGILSPGIKTNKKEKLNITFIVGDAEALPFADNSFDLVSAKHMLYHLPHIQKGLNEIHRCLTKGGTCAITLNGKDNNPKLHEVEKYICKKYSLTTIHGQDYVNTENVVSYLKQFCNIKTLNKTGLMNRPDLFPSYFESFRDNYEPQPTNSLWKTIMNDVNAYVKTSVQKEGKFIETRINGLITAVK